MQGDFRIGWESQPALVSAVSDGSVIELTFDQRLQAAPAAGQFTVRVVNTDGSAETIAVSGVSVSGAVITLELESTLASGQNVTVGYAHAAATPLQRAGGGDAAPDFSGQAVELNLPEPPGEPQNFAVSVERGELNLWATWDEVEGATFYQLRWRQAGGEFEAANAVTVTDTSATITVSGYGEWEVRLQACNDAGCVPEDGLPADEVPAVQLNLEEAQGQSQSRSGSRNAASGPVEDETSHTLGWSRDGTNAQGPSQPEDDRQDRGAAGGPPGDGLRGASGQGDTTPPRLTGGDVDSDRLTLYFSEPLDEDSVACCFRLTFDWGERLVQLYRQSQSEGGDQRQPGGGVPPVGMAVDAASESG